MAGVRYAINEPVSAVVDIVKTTSASAPPGLADDVMDRGIALTAGGGLLRGLDERLREETGTPSIWPAIRRWNGWCSAPGKCVEDFDAPPAGAVPDRRR